MITKLGKELVEKEEYAHATSLPSLLSMLESGNLKSLRHIAKDDPEKVISVEPGWFPARKEMKASDAYKAMRENKNPDKIFFTRNGWLPNYGDCVITKQFGNSVKKHGWLNFVPEEYVTRRKASLKNNAKIYVPDAKAEEISARFKSYRVYPMSKLELRAYGIKDRISAFYAKLKSKLVKESSDNEYKKLFGRNARLVGSEPLGIALPGSSDIDVFVPYKRKKNFEKAVDRMSVRHPELLINSASHLKDDKKTFHGKVNGKEMDVVLAYGQRAERFENAFKEAMNKLNAQDRADVIKEKRRLKNAWFFPDWRYKRYKNELAEKLGLKNAYF